jgi:tetrachlorobenzoquinone reductase
MQALDVSPPADSAPALAIDVRLTAISYAARDTNLYEFRRPDGGILPQAEPGAHIDVHLPNGLVRQYSLVHADPAPRAYLIGVKLDRAGRGGSRAMHEGLSVGQMLTISAPRNNFPLAANAAPSVLFAGGIGITPIWCMVARLAQEARPWQLFYSCRSREDAAFLAPLVALGSRVTLNFEDESEGRFLDLAALVAAQPADAELYCCGPLPMLAAFEAASAGRPPQCVHVEYFTPKIAPARGGGFTVELARSHKEFWVPPDKSILGILLDAGIDVSYSCEEGVCGACETKVLAGTPNHCDNVLTDKERAENRTMMICCSGCKTERLVLDL